MKRFFVLNEKTLCILNDNPEYRYCSQGLPEAPLMVYARKAEAEQKTGETVTVQPTDFVRLAGKDDFADFDFTDFELDEELTDAFKAQSEGSLYSDNDLGADLLSLGCEASLVNTLYGTTAIAINELSMSYSAIIKGKGNDKLLQISKKGEFQEQANHDAMASNLYSATHGCVLRAVQAQVLLREVSRQLTQLRKLEHDIRLIQRLFGQSSEPTQIDDTLTIKKMEVDQGRLMEMDLLFRRKAAEYRDEATRRKELSKGGGVVLH